VIAHNLRILVLQKWGADRSVTAAFKMLAEAAQTTLSQVQRATSGANAIGVDTLERMADALGVRASDLLVDGAFVARTPLAESLGMGNATGGLHRGRSQ